MREFIEIGINLLYGVVAAAGVVTILIAFGLTVGSYMSAARSGRAFPTMRDSRRRLGSGLTLALEFFIAADVLRTVLQPSLEEVIVLSVVVGLRTIIALSLEYELRR